MAFKGKKLKTNIIKTNKNTNNNQVQNKSNYNGSRLLNLS